MEVLNEYLEILADHVLDNDKLVTYKWLSKILKVHVNIAKQILWTFYEKYHENHAIECTYLLIGFLNDNEIRVEVVRESDLSKAREKFSTIISEHLYSVHKSLQDLELLASSDPGDVNYSAIKCDACEERSDEEMQLLRWGTVVRKTEKENVANANVMNENVVNPLKMDKNMTTKENNGLSTWFNGSGKLKNSKETKSSFQKKDGSSVEKNKISTQEIKDLEKKDDLAEKDKNSIEKSGETFKDKNSKKVQNSIEKNKNFTTNSKKISPKSKLVKKGLDNFLTKLTSPPQPQKIVPSEENNDKTNIEVAKERKPKEKENLRGKKRNRSKDTDQSAKKRKRIIIQSDSSDSEVQSDAELEDTIPELETEPPVRTKSPSPPRMKHENGRKKVLKLVSKVYKENGYIVTKKEHVYVSCSEDEEEKKAEEEKRKMKKMETKTEKVKKKQSTLIDFFKKS